MAGKKGAEASSSNGTSSRNNSGRGESVVSDIGKRKNSCGYCRSGRQSSASHGLWAHSIAVDDYQGLLDRGWRRSGCYLYKPEMEKTCCPSYTIRLKAGDFVPSKEQLRVCRRMQRFLDGTFDGKKAELLTDGSSTSNSGTNSQEKNKEEQYLQFLSSQIDNVVHEWTESCNFPFDIQFPRASVKKMTNVKKKQIENFEDLLYSSNISFQIVAALKRSKMAEKAIHDFGLSRCNNRLNGQSSEVSPTAIAEKLSCILNQLGKFSGLSIKACKGHLNFYSDVKHASSGEGSTNVKHTSSGEGSTVANTSIFPPTRDGNTAKNSESCHQKRRKLEIRLKRSSFDPEEYALYRKYQIRVHNDTLEHVIESSYRRFLVDTPIVFVPPSGDDTVPSCGFGSFHQQYLVDGRLVAVGVVDILPKCLSSKYLFWDPDLAFLSLGKYSALQEISWVKENQLQSQSLQFYYLGYYIHSCSKMRYKAAYRPSELLCPLRYTWVPFDIARPLLDKKPYVVLSDSENMQNDSCPQEVSDNHIELRRCDPGEDPSEPLSDEDVEMMEPDFEGSEDDSDADTSDVVSDDEIQDGDVSHVLIGLKNTRMKFQDLQKLLGSAESNYLERQLHRYMKAVGLELSERIVYKVA